MYNKSKNRVLFAVFILVILLTVYGSREKNTMEEYKISLNSAIYDENYSYISLAKDAVLKKEWDKKYYLYPNDSNEKYSLGTETVFYDKSMNQVTIYGTVYQVYTNGDIQEKTSKTVIGNLSDFQFFKLNDRKYLIIGSNIGNENISTTKYLEVSIDKAGNALLLNNSINIKTINPLVLNIGDIKFDIANEKLINGESEIDLKKINGSTNEYVEKEPEEENNDNNNSGSNNNNNNNNGGNNGNTGNNSSTNNSVVQDIIDRLAQLSGMVSGTKNQTNLYKNVSLRSVNPRASYIDVAYSVVDPEDKYLSVYLALKDEDEDIMYYYLSKDSTEYRITGLKPNVQYDLTINYIAQGSNESIVADSIIVLTSIDPTEVRITKINGNVFTYNIKMYNEFEFGSAKIALTDCNGTTLNSYALNVDDALSKTGQTGEFSLDSLYTGSYLCLQLQNVQDVYGSDIKVNSYHKIKLN